MADPKQLLQRVINRLQVDIDSGERPDQWSMEDMVRTLRTVLAQAEPVRTRAEAMQDMVATSERAGRYELTAEPVEPVQAVSGVVIRESLPTLLRDRDIRPTDTRLYTVPQPRRPLTEEEIDHAANNIFEDGPVRWWRKLARAIEAAHGIKEKA